MAAQMSATARILPPSCAQGLTLATAAAATSSSTATASSITSWKAQRRRYPRQDRSLLHSQPIPAESDIPSQLQSSRRESSTISLQSATKTRTAVRHVSQRARPLPENLLNSNSTQFFTPEPRQPRTEAFFFGTRGSGQDSQPPNQDRRVRLGKSKKTPPPPSPLSLLRINTGY